MRNESVNFNISEEWGEGGWEGGRGEVKVTKRKRKKVEYGDRVRYKDLTLILEHCFSALAQAEIRLGATPGRVDLQG
jgi:hypothetical protein